MSYIYNIVTSNAVYDTVTLDIALPETVDVFSFALVHWKTAGTIKSNEDYGDIAKVSSKLFASRSRLAL